jgi:hypothetical protein
VVDPIGLAHRVAPVGGGVEAEVDGDGEHEVAEGHDAEERGELQRGDVADARERQA